MTMLFCWWNNKPFHTSEGPLVTPCTTHISAVLNGHLPRTRLTLWNYFVYILARNFTQSKRLILSFYSWNWVECHVSCSPEWDSWSSLVFFAGRPRFPCSLKAPCMRRDFVSTLRMWTTPTFIKQGSPPGRSECCWCLWQTAAFLCNRLPSRRIPQMGFSKFYMTMNIASAPLLISYISVYFLQSLVARCVSI